MSTPSSSLGNRPVPLSHRLLPWPIVLAIVLVIHVVSGWVLLRLQINNAPEVYYPSDTPAVQLRDALRREFPTDEALTVVFQGSDLYGRDFLQRLDRLATRLQSHPLVDRVTTITTLERISGTSDGFAVERLLDPRDAQFAQPDAARQRVMSDRFAPGVLASRDGTAVAAVIRPKPLSESLKRRELLTAVTAAIDAEGLGSHFAGHAGPVSVDVAQLDSVLRDSALFVPITTTIGLALLWWVVGRLKPVVIGAVAMSTVIAPTVAAVAAAGQPYTMATAILPSLLAGYTMATLLHFYAGVQRAHAAHLSRRRSVDRALSETLKSGFFNVITTGAGLLSLVLVAIPPLRVFGIAGALGTFFVFLTVFVLVPPVLVRWETRRWPTRTGGMGRLGRVATRLALFSMRHPKAMLVTAICLLLAAVPLMRHVQVESDFLAFFKPEHPLTQHTRLVESKFVGLTSLELRVDGGARDSLQSVETLRRLRDFQHWLEKLPAVDRAISMVDLVEEMHWAMNGEQPAFRDLPPNDRLLKQYLLVYDGRDLPELVNREFQQGRILLSLNVHGATQIRAVIDQINARLQAQPIPGVQVDVGGFGRLFADQIDLLVDGQINSFAGAFLQIFFFMAVFFRSAKGAAICLVPNLAPLFFIFVLMGAAGIPLDMATVMIAGVILGITVDDTIHLYHGYQDRLRRGISPMMAIARSFESSGRAVLAISLLLVSQFLVLTASDFVPTANFGLMTAVGLLAGQIFEILLLPALLVLKDASASARPRAAARVQQAPDDEEVWAATMLLEQPAAGSPATPGFDYDVAFSRNIGWVTAGEQALLRKKRVAIAGMGGVGGVHLLTLARLGIERFNIADLDVFEVANFNRQVGASLSSVGQPKVEVLAQMARDINPRCQLTKFPQGVNDENLAAFLDGVDLYIDGLDFFAFEARERVFAYCAAHGIPAVTVAPLGMSAALLNFMPGGMSFEDYFQLQGREELDKAVRFLVGLAPGLLHRHYLADKDRVNLRARKGPSTIMACQLCAGVAASEALKILLGRGKVLAAPHGIQFDGYQNRMAHTWRPGGNRNPINWLAIAIARRQLGL